LSRSDFNREISGRACISAAIVHVSCVQRLWMTVCPTREWVSESVEIGLEVPWVRPREVRGRRFTGPGIIVVGI